MVLACFRSIARLGLLFLLVHALPLESCAQVPQVEQVEQVDSEAVRAPIYELAEELITDREPSAREQRALDRAREAAGRLRRNVRYLYPMAKLAAATIRQVDLETKGASRSDQKLYLKRLEADLFGKYEKQLRKLSIGQGHILMQLIDRQTGHSAYDLIRQYKSGRTAFFWQMIARIFGTNLKTRYDPEREAAIEAICLEIDNGQDTRYQ
jgi:hypothetical protein